MTANWNDLREPLREIYNCKNLNFESDEEALKRNYIDVEKQWEEQFSLFKKIHFVLLGEAPFCSDKYFYNESAPLTSFFRHRITKDMKVESFPSKKDKSKLFECLRENGFIILDLFPYAFNPKTAVGYRKSKESEKQYILSEKDCRIIYERTSEVFLRPKLMKIKELSCDNSTFCRRYKAHDFIDDCLSELLRSVGFNNESSSIKCCGSKNVPLDKKELDKLLANQSCPTS